MKTWQDSSSRSAPIWSSRSTSCERWHAASIRLRSRDRGLADAVRSLAISAPIPVGVIDEGIGRCSALVEAAVYFCALEAVQNAVKHAGPDARVTVVLSRARGGKVQFEVTDDGVGMRCRSVQRDRPDQHARSDRRGRRRASRSSPLPAGARAYEERSRTIGVLIQRRRPIASPKVRSSDSSPRPHRPADARVIR